MLKVHYPLMVGARITGTFTLSDFEVTGRVRHETIQTLLFKTTQLLAEERARPVVQAPPITAHHLEVGIDRQFERLNVA